MPIHDLFRAIPCTRASCMGRQCFIHKWGLPFVSPASSMVYLLGLHELWVLVTDPNLQWIFIGVQWLLSFTVDLLFGQSPLLSCFCNQTALDPSLASDCLSSPHFPPRTRTPFLVSVRYGGFSLPKPYPDSCLIIFSPLCWSSHVSTLTRLTLMFVWRQHAPFITGLPYPLSLGQAWPISMSSSFPKESIIH